MEGKGPKSKDRGQGEARQEGGRVGRRGGGKAGGEGGPLLPCGLRLSGAATPPSAISSSPARFPKPSILPPFPCAWAAGVCSTMQSMEKSPTCPKPTDFSPANTAQAGSPPDAATCTIRVFLHHLGE